MLAGTPSAKQHPREQKWQRTIMMIGISHQRSNVSAPVMVFHLPSVDKDGRDGEKDTALIIFLVVLR
jgi:hypothetical protein